LLGPLGILLVLAAMRPYLLLGPLNLVLMFVTGSFRKTLEVRTLEGTFYFSVRNVGAWLESCAKAAQAHGLPSPLLNE
jgi:hypothetical protein